MTTSETKTDAERTKPGWCEPLEGSRATKFEDREWPWGPVVDEHEIDHIGVIEYRVDLSNRHGGDPSEHGRHEFAPYLRTRDGWKRLGHSCESMADALILAIAVRRCGHGVGVNLAHAFHRMTTWRGDR